MPGEILSSMNGDFINVHNIYHQGYFTISKGYNK